MKAVKEHRLIGVLALVILSCCIVGRAQAQTAGTVNLSVTPLSGNSPVTPTLTWSTTPVALSCAASGAWSGSRAVSGSVALPAITSSASYTLTCSWSGGLGSAVVNWITPTTNTDGSPLTDLAAFVVFYGSSASALTQSKAIADPAAASTTIASLTPGNWFFAVRSVNAVGVESSNSNVAQKAISGPLPVTASKTVDVKVNKVPSPPTNTTAIETTAYNVMPDLQHFLFFAGSRIGKVKIGAACDESRVTADGFTVISRNSQVTPKPAAGTVLVARCG